jgi:hypothetical protein
VPVYVVSFELHRPGQRYERGDRSFIEASLTMQRTLGVISTEMLSNLLARI